MYRSLDHRLIHPDGVGEIHYVTAGEGPPLVLLHGLGASVVAWRSNISALAERYTVYAPDLPGHGDSAKPHVTYDLEYGVRFVLGFLDALGLETAALMGNSLGGLLALATALRHPARVRALVLVDPAGLGREIAWPLRLVSLPGVGGLLDTLDVHLGLRFMRRVFHHPERIDSAVAQELLRLRKQPEVRWSVLSSIRNGVTLLGLRPSLVLLHNSTYLPLPTLVVWGQEDRIVPVAHAHRVARHLPHVRVHILPECGHWPQMERSQEFNEVVLDFLESALDVGKERSSP